MSKINSYRDLRVWQDSIDLAECAYRASASFPRDEMYGLTSQMRRAVVSVSANIAEGYGRDNLGNYIQFLRIAQGSLKEVETHMILANRLGMAETIVKDDILLRCESVGKMLRALIRSLQITSANSKIPLPTAQSQLPERESL